MFNLMQSFNKVKAAVAVLVDEDSAKLEKIQHLYFQNATLIIDKEIEVELYNNKSRFIKFLERDEREVLMMEEKNQLNFIENKELLVNPLDFEESSS